MPVDIITVVGTGAALITAFSNLPQAVKCWRTQETEDLSAKMLTLLFTGLALWTIYGVIKGDWFIIAANSFSAAMIGYVLYVKIKNGWR